MGKRGCEEGLSSSDAALITQDFMAFEMYFKVYQVFNSRDKMGYGSENIPE